MPTQRSSKTSKAVSRLSSRDLALLRLVSEQGSIPVDQLASFLGLKLQSLKSQVRRLERAGWLASDSFAVDRHAWLRPTLPGVRRAGTGYLQRPPGIASLNHRRGVNEARIELSREFPEGRWISEAAILRRDGRLEDLPDGEFELDGARWAIEVELSRKSRPRVRRHVEGLAGYDKVIYYCADHVLCCVGAVQAALPAGRIEVRKAKGASFSPPPRCTVERGHRPTRRERRLLRLISEEGAVAVDQLAALVACELSELLVELSVLKRYGFLELGFPAAAPAGWVWCTDRGTKASGTGLARMRVMSPARLAHRRALMSVRLALTGARRPARWVTKRVLGQGTERGISVEMAVLEQGGKRSAVTVSLDTPVRFCEMAPLIGRFSDEYDAVLWYCAPMSYGLASRWLLKQAWENVEVRPLPAE